ncbi:MAG: hypothetical protein E7377_03900 [Clostridiales bacterium]|nr:hypothetical protein [Clostridiales bacterium]
MKKLKKLATLGLALMFTLGFGAFAACGGDDSTADNSSSEFVIPENVYVFKVVDQNSNPVEGVVVQLCKSMCEFTEKTNVDGLTIYAGAEEGATDYDIHVFSGKPGEDEGATQLAHTGATKTPTSFSKTEIVLTINR